MRELDADFVGDRGEALIKSPQGNSSVRRGCEQMHIDPSEPTPHETPPLREAEHVCMIDERNMWQG